MNDAKSIRKNSKLGAFIWLDLNLAMIMFVYQKHQENYFVQENTKARNSPTKKNENEKDNITKPGSSESYLPE